MGWGILKTWHQWRLAWAKDTCKLGYCWLSTAGVLLFNDAVSITPLSNRWVIMWEKCLRTAMPREEKPSCCLFRSNILQHWSKTPHHHTRLIKETRLLLWGVGYHHNCSTHICILTCLAWLSNETGFRNACSAWDLGKSPSPGLANYNWVGVSIGPGRVVNHSAQPTAGTKSERERMTMGFYFQLLLPNFPQFGFWTNNCHGNHYLRQFVFFAHFCSTFAKH